MSQLLIYSDKQDTTHSPEPMEVVTSPDRIAQVLNSAGVLFEQWATVEQLDSESEQDEIIEAYRKPVDQLMQRHGLESLEVISIYPDHPKKDELRHRYLQEHTHKGDEVRFFIEGQALFYIRHQEAIYSVRCSPGDLIILPRGLPHWVDMGDPPLMKVIRLFSSDCNGVFCFTGDTISERFPFFEGGGSVHPGQE